MGFDIFPRLRRVLTALCCVVGVGACSFECPEGNALDHAAIYRVIPSVGYSLPLDAWTRNPKLEAFVQQAIKTDGLKALGDKYGLQCSPRSSAADCADCYSCSKTFNDRRIGMSGIFFTCVNYGQLLTRAELGPGSTVSAMTYWKTTPYVPWR